MKSVLQMIRGFFNFKEYVKETEECFKNCTELFEILLFDKSYRLIYEDKVFSDKWEQGFFKVFIRCVGIKRYCVVNDINYVIVKNYRSNKIEKELRHKELKNLIDEMLKEDYRGYENER